MEYPTTCIQCGKSFEGKRADTKYCSSTCRSRASREANGDGGGADQTAGGQPESADRPAPMPPHPASSGDDADYEARLALIETRLAAIAGMSGRLDRLENQGVSLERLQARLSSLESAATEMGDIIGRLKRLEGQQSKTDARVAALPPADGPSSPVGRLSGRLDALETRFSPLAGLPERLRVLERRASESNDLAGRIEALEARGQSVQRLQKALTELQTRLEVGLEEARGRKSLDTTGAQRLIEARVAPLEQRVERVAAQARTATPSDDSRLLRLEQRVERLQGRTQAAPDEDSSGRLLKLERKLVALQTRFDAADEAGFEQSPVVDALKERLESLEESLSTLQQQSLQIVYAVRALQGVGADGDDESDWEEEDD